MTAGELLINYKNEMADKLMPGNITWMINEAKEVQEKTKEALLRDKNEELEEKNPDKFELDDLKNDISNAKKVANAVKDEIEQADRPEIGTVNGKDGEKAERIYKFGSVEDVKNEKNVNDDFER